MSSKRSLSPSPMRDGKLRTIFVGNFDYETRGRDLEKLFEKEGADVEKVEMKRNFAFVYVRDSRELREIVRDLDNARYQGARLRVEFAKSDSTAGRKESAKRSGSAVPNETLFIVNFDPRRIKERDLQNLYSQYGRLKRVEIRRTFAFVEFEDIEDAKIALDKTSGLEFHGDRLTVEYVVRKFDSTRFSGGRDRSRSRSPYRRRHRGRSRSRSPSYERRHRRSRRSPVS